MSSAVVDEERIISGHEAAPTHSRVYIAEPNAVRSERQAHGIGQKHVRCPVCGKQVSFDRWSEEPQEYVCSSECRARLSLLGIRTAWEVAVERARNPAICVLCNSPMADRKVRLDALYCSGRCQKAARRAGIISDILRKIRLSAINERGRGDDRKKARSG